MNRSGRFWLRLLVVNALIFAALLIAGLAAIEGYFRLTIPSSSGESLFQSTLSTRRYKVMRPNVAITAWGSELRTNDLGFRDNKPSIPPKADGTFRIVVLGDSFTVSAGVDYDRIYTSLLDAELAKRGQRAEVLNLAVGGYNIIQYEMVLNEVAFSLRPDLLVVAVFPFNDLSNDTYRANYDEASGHSAPPAKTSWFRELYVYRAVLSRVEGRVLSWFQPRPQRVDPAAADHRPNTDAAENLAALERIVETARSHNLPAIEVLLPNTDNFQQQKNDFAPFEEACRNPDWHCVNLLDRFAQTNERPSTLRLNALDPHPNDRYNALVARLLVDDLAAAVTANTSAASR